MWVAKSQILLKNLCRFVALCNSIVYTYNANRPERNDQVLKAYIAGCSMKVYSYVVVNYHGWHLNGINRPLMCLCLYLCNI